MLSMTQSCEKEKKKIKLIKILDQPPFKTHRNEQSHKRHQCNAVSKIQTAPLQNK